MEITKREVIAGFVIIAFMVIVGLFISDNISDARNRENAKYQKAVQIDNDIDMFQYGIDTNVGNAFVSGYLKAIDTVSYPEISGEYMYIKKVKEKYTKHKKRVKHTKTVNGKTKDYYTTEIYWTWDIVDIDSKSCNEVSFCGILFSHDKFDGISSKYIDTVQESRHIRYQYYGTSVKHYGTVFTNLSNNTISDNTYFYEDRGIEDVYADKTSENPVLLFWIIWVFLIVGCVVGFYYLDNRWLNS